MSLKHGASATVDNMVLCLDVSNKKSYPGTGTTWYDISGNSNNFTVQAAAYNAASRYMDFNGSYGWASRGTDIALDDTNGVTYVVATRIKNNNGDWRTLTRSGVSDHHVIVNGGGWQIGMYDNDGAAFMDSGYSQQSLPGYASNAWNILYWRWQQSSPQYQFSYNDTPGTIRGSISNVNARYNRGFLALGAYQGGSQYWGDIAYFAAYNRFLTDYQLFESFNALRGRFGI